MATSKRKMLILGSTAYETKIKELQGILESMGHDVRIPMFDTIEGATEMDTAVYNRDLIEWCDEVHLVWDGRSLGTMFNLGMSFALKKPLVINYLEPKNFITFIKRYSELYRL